MRENGVARSSPDSDWGWRLLSVVWGQVHFEQPAPDAWTFTDVLEIGAGEGRG